LNLKELEKKLDNIISDLTEMETIGCGDCLGYAFRMATKNLKSKAMKIVYGTVQNKWISNNKRYPHAWVIDKNKVYDWQTNDPKGPMGSKYAGIYPNGGWPKKEFYKFWNVKDDKSYSPLQVIDNWARTRSMMGWDW
jgi:hypothetical protein